MSEEVKVTEDNLSDFLKEINELMVASYFYIKLKDNSPNPFVKKLGQSEDEALALSILRESVTKLEPYIVELLKEEESA